VFECERPQSTRCASTSVWYGEWKPDGAPIDSFRAMYNGQVRIVGGSEMKDKIAYAFGAEFIEVRINRWTHEIRVPRMVGAFAAGHIMNPRTAQPVDGRVDLGNVIGFARSH
jgi:CO/xanthine dehydrogenase Mo-binding subunit